MGKVRQNARPASAKRNLQAILAERRGIWLRKPISLDHLFMLHIGKPFWMKLRLPGTHSAWLAITHKFWLHGFPRRAGYRRGDAARAR